MKFKLSFLIVFSITIPCLPAYATQTVTSPYVTQGQAGVILKGGYKFDGDAQSRDEKWQAKTEVFYNPTSYWQINVGGNYQQRLDDGADFSSLHLENKFQLAAPGTFFIDPGLRLKYLKSMNTAPDEIEIKFLMAKTTGPLDHIANLILTREVGEDSKHETRYGLSYSGAYKFTDNFKAGLEWYSDFGNLEGKFNQRNHQLGPVAYGKLGGGFGYQAGVLFGVSDNAADVTLKTVIDYKFKF